MNKETLSELCMKRLFHMTVKCNNFIGQDKIALHYIHNIWCYMSKLSPEVSQIYFKRLFYEIQRVATIDDNKPNSWLYPIFCCGIPKRRCNADQIQQRVSKLLPIFSYQNIVFEDVICDHEKCDRKHDPMFGPQTEFTFQTLVKSHFENRLLSLDISRCESRFEFTSLLSNCLNLKELILGDYCEPEEILKSVCSCPLEILELGYSRWLTPEKYLKYFLNLENSRNITEQCSSICNKIDLKRNFNSNYCLKLQQLNLLVKEAVSLSKPKWKYLKRLIFGLCLFGRSEIIITLLTYQNLEVFNMTEIEKMMSSIIIMSRLDFHTTIQLKSIKLTPTNDMKCYDDFGLLQYLPQLCNIDIVESPDLSYYNITDILFLLESTTNFHQIINMKLEFATKIESLQANFSRFPATFLLLEKLELSDVNSIMSFRNIIELLKLCANLIALSMDFLWIESSIARMDTSTVEFLRMSSLKLAFSFFPKPQVVKVILNLFPTEKNLVLDAKCLSTRLSSLNIKCTKQLKTFYINCQKSYNIRECDKVSMTLLAKSFLKENKDMKLFACLSKNFDQKDIDQLRETGWRFY